MKPTHKYLLVGSILAVLLIAVFSAGCTSVFEDGLNFFNGDSGSGSAANNPTDTTTKMTLPLTANQWTNHLGTYPMTSIGTVSGSPAQLTVSLTNGYNIVASPKKIVLNGGGKTVDVDIDSQIAVIHSGSKTLTITPHDGATAESNGKTTTYKESGAVSWENIGCALNDFGGGSSAIPYSIASKPSIIGSSLAHENGFKFDGPKILRVSHSNAQQDSHVFINVDGNTVTAKVTYIDPSPKYRKVTQSMSLTWDNGKWHLYKAVEDNNTIDKEELSG